MNSIKVGGWMKYRYKKKYAFTIIESIVYIFLTTIIFLELLTLVVSFYASYIEIRNISINQNNIRNFYINLDCILNEENNLDIRKEDNSIVVYKDIEYENLVKHIKFYNTS